MREIVPGFLFPDNVTLRSLLDGIDKLRPNLAPASDSAVLDLNPHYSYIAISRQEFRDICQNVSNCQAGAISAVLAGLSLSVNVIFSTGSGKTAPAACCGSLVRVSTEYAHGYFTFPAVFTLHFAKAGKVIVLNPFSASFLNVGGV